MADKLTLPVQVGKKYMSRTGDACIAEDTLLRGSIVVRRVRDGARWVVREDDGAYMQRITSTHSHDLVADHNPPATYIPATACPHADLMAEYAKDAATCAEPWLLWECAGKGEKVWRTLGTHPGWDEHICYRRRPRTITATLTIPEPLRVAPAAGSEVWGIGMTGVFCVAWDGDGIDQERLATGILFAEKEQAQAALDAILVMLKGGAA